MYLLKQSYVWYSEHAEHFTNSSMFLFLNINTKGYKLNSFKTKQKKSWHLIDSQMSRPLLLQTVQGGQDSDPCCLQLQPYQESWDSGTRVVSQLLLHHLCGGYREVCQAAHQ